MTENENESLKVKSAKYHYSQNLSRQYQAFTRHTFDLLPQQWVFRHLRAELIIEWLLILVPGLEQL